MTDTEIKKIAFQILNEKLGELDTERFVALLLREPANYTAWQSKFFEDKDVKSLSQEAMKMREYKKNNA
ncbi:MAG: hypothetical protein NW226_13665 [Microscillaceae bacterium]|nr:hypothetical protein [Microscillaceae bacterium]